jgi:thiamine-phosphate pyrophosphorylase
VSGTLARGEVGGELGVELIEAAPQLHSQAIRIRAQLGEWTPAAQAWRIWTQAAAKPAAGFGPGDLLIRDDDVQPADSDLLARGAALLSVVGDSVSLAAGQNVYRLHGAPAPQWVAAWAAFLDCGFEPQDALCLAWGWRDDPEAADAWPRSLEALPRVAGLPPQHTPFPHCPAQLGLYPVVPDAQWVARLLELGVKTVQLRCKSTEQATLEREVRRAVDAGRAHNARVFINDHWQLALQAGAYGVHLGQEDWCNADLEALAQSGIRLGLSTHGVYEMLVAWHFRPSYIATGAVFPTATKQVATAPLGLARLHRYVGLLAGQVPGVAIGGISLAQLPSVLASGVGSAAVVSAITGAADVPAAVAALQRVFEPRQVSA